MHRSVRALTITGALASTAVLAACQKPAPELTLQTGSFSTRVAPSSYSFDAQHLRQFRVTLPEVTAKTGGNVLIDVPRQVADAGWGVTAISLDTKHTQLGQSGQIRNRHTYRVAAQTANGEPFIVRINQYRNGKADGSQWAFLLKVDDGA